MANYGTAAAFRTYNQARGRSIPASWTDDVIVAALLVASEWLDGAYANLWIGTPTAGYTQDRQWPRTDATTNTTPPYTFADNEIPTAVINATYEAAFREATNAGALNIDFTPSQFKKVTVEGAIQVEYRTDFVQPSELQTQVVAIQTLMAPLIDPNAQGNFSPLSGPSVRV